MLKVDLHTHSSASPDGGIKPRQYAQALDSKLLDVIAVTDHNSVSAALELHRSFPDQIIVGEEIMTTEGEIIGLFLKKLISPGLSPAETVRAIKIQGGLVYLPHPLETVRHGLPRAVLDELGRSVDIVEVQNGRAWLQNFGPQSATWAHLNHCSAAASSDAHGFKGLGYTYTSIAQRPTPHNLVQLIARGRLVTARAPLRTLLYPKAHRLKRRLIG